MDTVIGYGAHVKGHMDKCNINIASFHLSGLVPIPKPSVFPYNYIFTDILKVPDKMYYLFVWQPNAVGKDCIAILQTRQLRFRELSVIKCY